MKYLAAALPPIAFMALIAFGIYSCDSTAENIRQCAYACEKSERVMDKYSQTDGCVCKNKR